MLTDSEKLAKIERIVTIWTLNTNDEDGDKYLSDAVLAMEAVESVLEGTATGSLRDFEQAGA